MYLLANHTICPFCRKIRIMLEEARVEYGLKEFQPWDNNPDLEKISPEGKLPYLIKDGASIVGNYAITEFLNDDLDKEFIFGDALQKAEVRRMTAWFDEKFYKEVFMVLTYEKLFKRIGNLGAPDSSRLRIGVKNLSYHLSYLNWLLDRRKCVAGSNISLADYTAAAYLSLLDYSGDIVWENYKNVKQWYSRIKSRPSFRCILQDRFTGILPSEHYSDLDF